MTIARPTRPCRHDQSFRLRETTSSKLWDFGWFDRSEFDVGRDLRAHGRDVLSCFLQSPIAQRSFCTSPDPWGAPVERHGPYFCATCDSSWFDPITEVELRQRIAGIMGHPEFEAPPSREQRGPVDEWVERAASSGGSLFVLSPPARPDVRVEWDVWTLFHEFLCLSPDDRQLSVGVFGHD